MFGVITIVVAVSSIVAATKNRGGVWVDEHGSMILNTTDEKPIFVNNVDILGTISTLQVRSSVPLQDRSSETVLHVPNTGTCRCFSVY